MLLLLIRFLFLILGLWRVPKAHNPVMDIIYHYFKWRFLIEMRLLHDLVIETS